MQCEMPNLGTYGQQKLHGRSVVLLAAISTKMNSLNLAVNHPRLACLAGAPDFQAVEFYRLLLP
jgi:hypothetical protein